MSGARKRIGLYPGTDLADPEDAVEEPPAEQPAPSRQAMAASTAPVVRT